MAIKPPIKSVTEWGKEVYSSNMIKLINWIKKWFRLRKEAKLPVLYCVHGFGVRRTVEFDPLRIYFEKKGHKVVSVELFDQVNELEPDLNLWLERAEAGLENLLAQKRKVWLVGFSMGGVIASQLAAIYPVERVVLLAPAFEYISIQTVKNLAHGVARSIIKKPKDMGSSYAPLPDNYTSVFRSVVANCKDSINKIKCPILFIHGSSDETIPVRSSENAYAKVHHQQKMLLVVQDVAHRVLDDEHHNQDILKIIDDFFNKTLIKPFTSNNESNNQL